MIAYNRTSGRTVAARVARADGPFARARGLLGRAGLEPGEGLWIVPCSMIHTWFMRFPLDVLFLDGEGRVLRVLEELRPWRLSPWVPAAAGVLELAGGALQGAAKPGDVLEFK